MRQEMPNSPTRRSRVGDQAHGGAVRPATARPCARGRRGRRPARSSSDVLVRGEALPVLGREVHRELVRDVDARDRDRLVVLHLAGELARQLDRLQAAAERPPEAALEESLDLLLDVAQEAHAVGLRSVADALAGTRRRRTRQGRMAQASTITAGRHQRRDRVRRLRGGRDQRRPRRPRARPRRPPGAGRPGAPAAPAGRTSRRRPGRAACTSASGRSASGSPEGRARRSSGDEPSSSPPTADGRGAPARQQPVGARGHLPGRRPRPSPRPPPTGAPASAARGRRRPGRAARGRSRTAPARRRAAGAAGRCASRSRRRRARSRRGSPRRRARRGPPGRIPATTARAAAARGRQAKASAERTMAATADAGPLPIGREVLCQLAIGRREAHAPASAAPPAALARTGSARAPRRMAAGPTPPRASARWSAISPAVGPGGRVAGAGRRRSRAAARRGRSGRARAERRHGAGGRAPGGLGGRSAGDRVRPGEALVDDQAGRVDVRRGPGALAARLLGGHVGDRPDDAAGQGEAALARQPGDAEVRQAGAPVGAEQDVRPA